MMAAAGRTVTAMSSHGYSFNHAASISLRADSIQKQANTTFITLYYNIAQMVRRKNVVFLLHVKPCKQDTKRVNMACVIMIMFYVSFQR